MELHFRHLISCQKAFLGQPPGLTRLPGAEGDSKARAVLPAEGQDKTQSASGCQAPGRPQGPEERRAHGFWQQENDLILFHSMKHVFSSKTNFPLPHGSLMPPAHVSLCPSTHSGAPLPKELQYSEIYFLCIYKVPEFHIVQFYFLSPEGYAACL